MKLKNRFLEEVRSEWNYCYSCSICGQNSWDSLHHIISPSMRWYVSGKHNTSVLNSAPLCNFKCHLYNPNLGKKETVKILLNKTKDYLMGEGYQLKEIDNKFLEIYARYY